ncbi:MAG: tetratricopeptide repeat protein [Akkermansiaceae bacterium]|nr:tetratricopeptide repeat protein [Akkermansiaceae bacterium]
MKAIQLLLLCLFAAPVVAQEKSAPALKKEALTANQQAFLNLPEEKRNEFVKILTEANRLFQQKRIFETIDKVQKAASIFSDSPEIYNLRGSCYVEMRAFDKALADFQKAQSFSSDASVSDYNIDFNIGEVYFVTKQWQKSVDTFAKVMKALPPENVALGRLVEFKILLGKKKLGLDNDVTILAGKYDFLDDSPFYYYVQAVLEYDKKNSLKAEEWLAVAGRIFQDPNVVAPWQDTLVEYGYIKSFYGDDDPTEK